MALIVFCTVCILLVMAFGSTRQYCIEYEDGSYRIVPTSGVVFCFVATLVLVSTLRYGFIDTYAYKEMYVLSNHNWDYIFTGAGWGIEAGWLFLMYLLNFVSASPKLMLFLGALIINTAYAKVCKKYSEQALFSLFLYFCLMYLDTNNGLRQMVAMAIIMLAFPHLERGRYVQYLFFIFLAYQLHNSAIVCLAIVAASIGKAFNLRTKLALALGLLFVVAPGMVMGYIDNIFQDSQYNYYLDMKLGMSIWRALVTGVVPLALAILYMNKQRRLGIGFDRAECILLNITIINSMFVLMGTYMQYWNRFAFYTFYAPIVMLPKMARGVFGDKAYSKTVKPLMIILYFIYFAYNIYSNTISGALDKFYIEWWC